MSDHEAQQQSSETHEQPAQEEAPQTAEEDKTQFTVYVGNLSWSTNEEGLKEAFKQYGNITSVRIPKYNNGRPKGFGFVEFETIEEANKACEMNDKELDGRTLKVNISKPIQPKPRRDFQDRRDNRRSGYDARRGYNDRGYDRRNSYGDRRGYNRGYDRRDGY